MTKPRKWHVRPVKTQIRVFAVRMKKAWVLSYPLSADRSLHWAHSPFVGFVMRWLIFHISPWKSMLWELIHLSRLMTKPIKWHLRPTNLDQLGHLPSLNRVFAVGMKKAWVLSYPLSAQRRLWSDWADAQVDLSLRCAHMQVCWFCHEEVHFYLVLQPVKIISLILSRVNHKVGQKWEIPEKKHLNTRKQNLACPTTVRWRAI